MNRLEHLEAKEELALSSPRDGYGCVLNALGLIPTAAAEFPAFGSSEARGERASKQRDCNPKRELLCICHMGSG